MGETVQKFSDGKYDSYNDRLKSSYLSAYDDLNNDKQINLVLFVNTELSNEIRESIAEFANTDEFDSFNIFVYDLSDYELQEATIFQDSDLIVEDRVDLMMNDDNKYDRLAYGKDGIIVNVKASSLKRLYGQYGKHGLFSYNLREHITQASVDDEIEKTIREEPQNFWFYNNGITIGCEDFSFDGNVVRLYNFSIINGAQTTTKIGESTFVNKSENDFSVVCKIVRAPHSVNKDQDFISRISEASNSQKPIRPRDLKSNMREQKILQSNCAKNSHPLCIEIKRGVTPSNSSKVEKWQRVTNEYLGQLIYSCLYQRPYIAYGRKSQIFSSKSIYKDIYKVKHDSDTLYDLVRLGSLYDEFAAEYVKKSDDVEEISVVKYGKLAILAALIYLYKKEKGIVRSFSDEALSKDNISGLLVSDYDGDNINKLLFELFQFIMNQLKFVYATNKVDRKITSYSNFFKQEEYYSLMLKQLDSIQGRDKDKITDLMKVFTLKKQ